MFIITFPVDMLVNWVAANRVTATCRESQKNPGIASEKKETYNSYLVIETTIETPAILNS